MMAGMPLRSPLPRLTLLGVGLIVASVSLAQDAPVEETAAANLGSSGGVVRLTSGAEVALLPASGALEPGWHRLQVETAASQLPLHEAVGSRPIDRRSSGPLGQVEGPPVPLGPGLRLNLIDPEPSEEVGTGAVDAADWRPWLDAVPADLMPYLPPEQEATRQGFLIRLPGAGPSGTKERVSTWLYSPGGMRRTPARGSGEDVIEAWDPCLKLGRLDDAGNAWFYLSELTCGLAEGAAWTPLREQSQKEFDDWVLQETPQDQHRDIKAELRRMARDEAKLERER